MKNCYKKQLDLIRATPYQNLKIRQIKYLNNIVEQDHRLCAAERCREVLTGIDLQSVSS